MRTNSQGIKVPNDYDATGHGFAVFDRADWYYPTLRSTAQLGWPQAPYHPVSQGELLLRRIKNRIHAWTMK